MAQRRHPEASQEDLLADPQSELSTQLAASITLSAPAMSLLQAFAGNSKPEHLDEAALDELDRQGMIQSHKTGYVVTKAGKVCLRRDIKGGN